MEPGRPAGHDGERADGHGRASSTIRVGPRPRVSGPSSQIEAIAIAGIVSPMLAIAEP